MSLYNQTNTTNFILDIPDGKLTEAFVLNVQTANLPGMRIPVSDLPSDTQGLGRAQLPGSTFEHDQMPVRFLIDENFDSWLCMYRWMLSINNYINHNNTAWKPKGQPEAVTLHILNNDRTEIVLSYHMYGAWVSDMSEVEFNYTEETDLAMTCTAMIAFKYFEIEKDGIIISSRPNITDSIMSQQSSKMSVHPSMR